ncbi:MAG: dihydrolipoyl dehydrogenase family protein [Dehalococcoidia bacterium]
MARQDYDLVVIGGGSAGLTAARFAARLGRRVALVEKDRIGGDCTWTGCVPSKTLLKTAKLARDLRHAARYGLPQASQRQVDLEMVMSQVRSVIDDVYQAETPEKLQEEGIEVYLETAEFQDPHTIRAGATQLSTKRALIATGARPLIPPIAGLENVDYLTYESVWDLTVLPQRLVVVGGGPIGCELAQAFCRLGSQVTLLEGTSRILLQDEPEASELIAQTLAQDGVDLRLNTPLESVRQAGPEIVVTASGQELRGERLLMSVGRRPHLSDLGLDQAEIDYSPLGINVNNHLRTTQKHIYAAGDCVGGYQFTHYAGWQGFMAVRNAFFPGAQKAALDLVPWATFTDPEVARTGLSELQAKEKYGDGIQVARWPMQQVDRAVTEGDTAGFIRVVHRPNGQVLGATIVNPRAGEMIHEWILAQDRGLKFGDLSKSLHVYPTYSLGSLQLASEMEVSRLLSGRMGKLVRGVSKLLY